MPFHMHRLPTDLPIIYCLLADSLTFSTMLDYKISISYVVPSPCVIWLLCIETYIYTHIHTSPMNIITTTMQCTFIWNIQNFEVLLHDSVVIWLSLGRKRNTLNIKQVFSWNFLNINGYTRSGMLVNVINTCTWDEGMKTKTIKIIQGELWEICNNSWEY